MKRKAMLPTNYIQKNRSQSNMKCILGFSNPYIFKISQNFIFNFMISVGNTERKTGDSQQPSRTKFLLL